MANRYAIDASGEGNARETSVVIPANAGFFQSWQSASKSGVALCLLLLAACETLQYAPRAEIAKLPVFKVNEAPSNAGDHVTHYPTGTLFPIEITAEGSMFAQQAQTPLLVQLSRDVYVYKQWASFDGKRWTNAHKLFDLRIDGGLSEKGALMKFEWDAR